MQQRDNNIDNLRGLAIIFMILTHATAWYRKDFLANSVWDYTHFVVPIFIFCSLFLFFNRPVELSWKDIFPYFKKRLLRLLIPYYIYLAIYYLLQFFLTGKKIAFDYIVKSAFCFGGPDASWLVTLFIYLTVLSPLIWQLFKKSKPLFYLFGIAALGSNIYFLFNGYSNYRQIMWLPWSTMIYFTLYFVVYISKKIDRVMIFSFISLMIFFGLRFFLLTQHKSLVLFNNKYPPNLYYLAYGIFFVLFGYFISSQGFFSKLKSESLLAFFSKYSYSIYFIHNIVIYLLDKLKIKFSIWWVYFLVITALSLATQFIFNLRNGKVSKISA